jgi:hypothetical protein
VERKRKDVEIHNETRETNAEGRGKLKLIRNVFDM